MIAWAPPRKARKSALRPLRRSPPRVAPPRQALPAAQPAPLELERLAAQWQRALDAAERGIRAARTALPGPEVASRRRALATERAEAAASLARLAAETGRPTPWLSPVPVTAAMLGLPPSAQACLFDLEGVLTDSAVLHAWAWGAALDELLLHVAGETGWQFVPFDRDGDYRAYLDGRSRLEGVHAFLESRGIRLPEGRPGDPASARTAHGVARHKGELLARRLRRQGVNAVAGARRYLDAAGRAGLGRAVVSASASTLPMLELAGLEALVEARVDADVIRVERLRSRPAPDLLLAACRSLGVEPRAAVTFTHAPAGVAAGRAAGLTVVGVAADEEGDVLLGFGADRVVPTLRALLDRRLAP